eukprot:4437358-Prymnesium_polylepis.1
MPFRARSINVSPVIEGTMGTTSRPCRGSHTLLIASSWQTSSINLLRATGLRQHTSTCAGN